MAEQMPGDPDAGGRFVRLDDGDMHVVEDGKPGGPGVLLIHGTAASAAWWDPVIPQLAGACRVIRVDLSATAGRRHPRRYDIPAQARRVGAVLDRLGAGQVTAIGHSTGGYVATALAEQRPGQVAALALINTGPDPTPTSTRACSAGSCWPRSRAAAVALRTEATIRKALTSAFTRPIDIPGALIQDTLGMTHRALAATGRAATTT